MVKSKTELPIDLLGDLEATILDIEASAAVSVGGLMIASALAQNVEEERVAAMSGHEEGSRGSGKACVR